MILIGIGGNLESARFGSPRDTLSAALAALQSERITILKRSGWYRTEPIPPSDQPWFTNAVACLGPKTAQADCSPYLRPWRGGLDAFVANQTRRASSTSMFSITTAR